MKAKETFFVYFYTTLLFSIVLAINLLSYNSFVIINGTEVSINLIYNMGLFIFAFRQIAIEYETSKKFESLRKNIYEFSLKTFGTERSYKAPLHHLKEEIEEVMEDGAESEYADCLLLLLDSYSKRYPNNKVSDLIRASEDKLEILKTREWNEPDKNGVFKHKKL